VIVNICTKDVDDLRYHNPAVPEPVALLVKKALSRERDKRFADAAEFLGALATASGGVVSARALRQSEGDVPARSDAGDKKTSPLKTPMLTPNTGRSAYEPTLQVPEGGSSRVGWSTSGRTIGRQDKRIRVVIAVTSFIVAAGSTALYLRSRREEPAAEQAAPEVPADVSVRLQSNVPGAKFSVGGAVLEDGVLKGPKGGVRKVVVEAQGHAPREVDVKLEPSTEPVRITLEVGPPPVVSPSSAETPQPEASAAPNDPRKRPAVGTAKPTGAATSTPVASASAAPPPPPPVPTSKGTGIAPQLELKPE
jgi:serine/threonine-protein kinase